jgi:16S rRNA (cytosine967-C5)-methyltransferase
MNAASGGGGKSGGAKSVPQRTQRVSPARRASFEILRRVEEEGAFASVLLAADESELPREDRALSYEIVLGVLRRQLWLDYLIKHYTGRDAAKLDAPVRLSLRMGLYQLRHLSRIPPSAVVNESVNLAHLARVRSAAGLINAALRRAVREPGFDPARSILDPFERISVKHSHPLWLIKRWAESFGLEETEKFAAANNEVPPVAFRLVHAREEEQVLSQLSAAGARVVPSGIAPAAWRVEGATPLVRELARLGRIYLQDEASQLVAHVLDARPGEHILDACAAPGSKTTHIASRAPDGALVVAGDLHEHRLRLLLASTARQGLKNVRAVSHDASHALPFPDRTFDRVLVDAPCTGTGTLRRNPEIRWRITAEDIQVLQKRQLRILRNAARTLRPKGLLVYSTCSVEPEENEQVVAAFLQRENEFRGIKAPVAAGLQTEAGAARTWPHRDGVDGFFIAALERT